MTAKDKDIETPGENQGSIVDEKVDNAVTEEKEPVKTCEDELAELNDKYIRLYSEFENFRRRTAKERVELITNAGQAVIRKLLPIADDFDRAIAANQSSNDIDAVKEGMLLVSNKFKNILVQEGLKEMDAMNENFDSEHHEAIARIPAPKKSLKGKIVDVVEKGYYLNDKIIRHAKVVIGE